MKKIIGVAVAAVAVVGLSGCSSMNQQTYTGCVVQEKERLIQDGSSGTKRVVTSCGVFSVDDSMAGGFNSYDTWTRLVEGKTYTIKTGGYRIGFLSSFQTVLEVTEEA